MKLLDLKTKFLGKKFEYFEKIDSTQAEIWRRIKNENIENGLVTSAEIQTNGIGTHGRIWHTDEKNNIAFSFYLETNCNVSKLEGMTIEIAEIILKIFKDYYNIDLQIKAPNDIFCNGKKIGGILCQTKLNNEIVKYIVIGIGINTSKMNFTEDIINLATSIKKEFNIEVDNQKIITEFCNLFEEKINKRIGEN